MLVLISNFLLGKKKREREEKILLSFPAPSQEKAMLSVASFSNLKCNGFLYNLLTRKTLKIFCIK